MHPEGPPAAGSAARVARDGHEDRRARGPLTEYEPGRDLKELMVPQHPAVELWLQAWAEGIDLWHEMYLLDLG